MALKKTVKNDVLYRFGSIFFEIYDYMNDKQDFISLKVFDIESTITEIAALNQELKLRLCSRMLELDKDECSILTELVRAEQSYEDLKECFQILKQYKEILKIEKSERNKLNAYFSYLQNFLLYSTNQWKDRTSTREEIDSYFHQLAKGIRECKERYKDKILRVKEWEQVNGHVPVGSPLQVYSNQVRLQLLRNLETLELVACSFEENSEKEPYRMDAFGKGKFIVNEEVEHFIFKGEIEL